MKYIVIKYCGDVHGKDENVCYQCPECHKSFWGKPDTCTCGVGFGWSKDDDGMGDGTQVRIDQEDVHRYTKNPLTKKTPQFLCPNCGVTVTREQDHCDYCHAEIIWE